MTWNQRLKQVLLNENRNLTNTFFEVDLFTIIDLEIVEKIEFEWKWIFFEMACFWINLNCEQFVFEKKCTDDNKKQFDFFFKVNNSMVWCCQRATRKKSFYFELSFKNSIEQKKIFSIQFNEDFWFWIINRILILNIVNVLFFLI